MVSDRRLLDAQLNAFEVPQESRAAVSAWIDRRDKLSAEAWRANAGKLGLSDRQLSKVEAMLADKDLWKTSAELPRFFEAIGSLGLSDYVRFDAGVVRGFTYYTGTVFEAWEVGGDIKRSILGGGRYDRLLADVGGDLLPAVGYAMGDVVFTLLLEKYGLLTKELKVNPADVLVTVFSQELFGESLKLASELRANGLNVVCYAEPAKLPKQFKYADRMGMRLVTVIGPEEAEASKVTIKDLGRGKQVTVAGERAAEAIRQALAKHLSS
jgi:histidyl-tRNA synthetase